MHLCGVTTLHPVKSSIIDAATDIRILVRQAVVHVHVTKPAVGPVVHVAAAVHDAGDHHD